MAELLLYNHPEYHLPSSVPVYGCLLCDEEISRPVKRCHGLGSSSTVIPRLLRLSSSLQLRKEEKDG